MTAHAIQPDALYTYQDLSRLFQVCVKVVARWWHDRPKFKAGNTVRIAGSDVLKFIQERSGRQGRAK